MVQPGTNTATHEWAQCDMLRGSAATLHRPIHDMCPNEVFGEPAAATPEKGERILQAVQEAIVTVIDDLTR